MLRSEYRSRSAKLESAGLPDLGHEARRDQGMPAELGKEIGIETDDRHPEYQLAAARSCASVRRSASSCTPAVHHGERQAASVLRSTLPEASRGSSSACARSAAPCRAAASGERALCRLDIEIRSSVTTWATSRLPPPGAARPNGRRAHARLVGDQHLDLAELDAIAADLHLVVDPAMKNEPARGVEATASPVR